MRRLFSAAALVLVATACDVEQMRLERVTPRSVREGAVVDLTIEGGGFHWRYDSMSDELAGRFRVLVGQAPLEDVTWVDATQLRGTLPGDVEAGLYDVTVEGPGGKATRRDALVVLAHDGFAGDVGSSDGG